MPEWLNLQDPLVRRLVYAAGGFLALVLVLWFWRRLREQGAAVRRRRELRQTYERVRLRQEEVRQLADKIIATSSTGAIAGFVIVRQIETVFTDGHRSSAEAVETLKALAARKGANALINLAGQRVPSGGCMASGDAVIVRPVEAPSPADDMIPPAPPANLKG